MRLLGRSRTVVPAIICLLSAWVMAHPHKVYFDWMGHPHVVCSAPREPTGNGYFLFEYCTDRHEEIINYKNGPMLAPGGRPRNRFATAAWMGCLYHYEVTAHEFSAACKVSGATKISWKANFCSQPLWYWNRPEHRGDPFFQAVPNDGKWDHYSRGVSVSLTSKPASMLSSAELVSTQLLPEKTDDRITAVQSSNATQDVFLPQLPNSEKSPSEGQAVESSQLFKRAGNGNGPYNFEFCTENRLEAWWLHPTTPLTQRRFVSNPVANQAWLECDSNMPFVHTFEYSRRYCAHKNGQLVQWWGQNCIHPLSYYQKLEASANPRMAIPDARGCSSGMHVS